MSNERDKADFSLLKAGDPKGLEALVRRYYQPLFATSYRYVLQREVAEELAQDVFLAFWEKRGQLTIEGNLAAYLQTSIRNRSINYLKSQYARRQQVFVELPEVPTAPSLENDTEELELLLKQAIAQLPEKCAIVFKMSRFGEMTYEEIAQQLGISKETVKSQIKTALARIRTFLGECLDGILLLWIIFLL